MYFTGNSGSYGGAIALYECSYIVLYNETKLTFINNNQHLNIKTELRKCKLKNNTSKSSAKKQTLTLLK